MHGELPAKTSPSLRQATPTCREAQQNRRRLQPSDLAIDGQLRQRPDPTAVRGRQQWPLANTPFGAGAVGVGSACGAYECQLGVRRVPQRPPQSASVSGAAFRDPPRALRSDRHHGPALVARRIGPTAHAKRPSATRHSSDIGRPEVTDGQHGEAPRLECRTRSAQLASWYLRALAQGSGA